MNTLQVKRLTSKAKLPTKAHTTDAGWDLYADFSKFMEDEELLSEKKLDYGYIGNNVFYIILRPGDILKIPTGLAITPPGGCFCKIEDRSSMGVKGVRVLAGVCDQDYTGEYIVILSNVSRKDVMIYHGDKIAQFLVLPVVEVQLLQVTELLSTERSLNGFGSSGN